MADVALEIDPNTGLLAYSQVVLIGPRQATGKTEFLLPVMTHRCVGFTDQLSTWIRRELGIKVAAPPPQWVFYTAQTADDAKKKWRDIHVKRLEASSFYKPKPQFDTRLRNNFEAILWRNGARWSPGSTTGKTAGTGDSIDMGVIDEAWSRPDSRTELGMRPATMTRLWRQMWVTSMIPGLSRALPDAWPYLREKRALGRQRVEAGINRGVAFFDFSAPDGLDPADPETWYSCMPGLGRTVPEQAVRDDFEAMDLIDFCAEYLGWEPKVSRPQWSLFKETTWTGLEDSASTIAGRPAIAVEMNQERTRGWIGAAGYRPDGDYHVEIVEPGFRVPASIAGVDWMLERTVEVVEAQNATCVVIDPRRPANSLIPALKQRGITVITPSVPDTAGACARFYDATGQALPAGDERDRVDDGLRVHHLGQQALDRAVGVAVPFYSSAGAMTFVGKGAGEVGPLYVVALAMHGSVLMPPEEDVDLLDTIDQTRRCDRCGRYTYLEAGSWLHAEDDSPAC